MSDMEGQILPAIFRKWKDNGHRDIWFPTWLADVSRAGELLMEVYGEADGHSAGSWRASLANTVPLKPVEYADLKEDYERRFKVVLVPYLRMQSRFWEDLRQQDIEWRKRDNE